MPLPEARVRRAPRRRRSKNVGSRSGGWRSKGAAARWHTRPSSRAQLARGQRAPWRAGLVTWSLYSRVDHCEDLFLIQHGGRTSSITTTLEPVGAVREQDILVKFSRTSGVAPVTARSPMRSKTTASTASDERCPRPNGPQTQPTTQSSPLVIAKSCGLERRTQ